MARAILILFLSWTIAGCSRSFSANLSPDGRTVYEATKEGLHMRPYNQPNQRTELVRGENIGSPKASPSGDKLLYSRSRDTFLLDLATNRSERVGPSDAAGDCEWIDGDRIFCKVDGGGAVVWDAANRRELRRFKSSAARTGIWVSEEEGYAEIVENKIKLQPSGRTVASLKGFVVGFGYDHARRCFNVLEVDTVDELPTRATWETIHLHGATVDKTVLEDPVAAAGSGRLHMVGMGVFSPQDETLAVLGFVDRSPAGVAKRYLELGRKKKPTAAEAQERARLEKLVRVDVRTVLHRKRGSPVVVAERMNVPLSKIATDLHWSADGSTVLVEYIDSVSTRRIQ